MGNSVVENESEQHSSKDKHRESDDAEAEEDIGGATTHSVIVILRHFVVDFATDKLHKRRDKNAREPWNEEQLNQA